MREQEHPATASLVGLAVGDAFGSQITLPGDHPTVLERRLPAAPWSWTDDTEMACAVYMTLSRFGCVDQDGLAAAFAAHYDPDRGYGAGVARMLLRYRAGEPWQQVAPVAFGGNGSWGNGAAMRVAPLGAWFGTDLDAVVAQATRSAVVTHHHPEGVAGAIAVAVAAAIVATTPQISATAFLEAVASRVPPGEVHRGIQAALGLVHTADPREAGDTLGVGHGTSAQDTVPLALWIASRNLSTYEEAMWTAARVAADVDTVCAIAGGIIAAGTGSRAIPRAWRDACEPLPAWSCSPDLLADAETRPRNTRATHLGTISD